MLLLCRCREESVGESFQNIQLFDKFGKPTGAVVPNQSNSQTVVKNSIYFAKQVVVDSELSAGEVKEMLESTGLKAALVGIGSTLDKGVLILIHMSASKSS